MADPMASPSRVKNPYLNHRTFLGSRELIARRMSLASPLPSFHAAFPAVLPATGATFAPTLAPVLAARLFLRAIHYLHVRKVVARNNEIPRKALSETAQGKTPSRCWKPQAVCL